MTGEIVIQGLWVDARIGALPEEHGVKQRVAVSLRLVPDRTFAEIDDRLERAVDYAAVAKRVQTIALERHRELIETLADDLIRCLLREFRIDAIDVEVRKFILPDAEYVAVRAAGRQADL